MTSPRILIADPHPDTGRFLQSCLLRAGYSVPVSAATGKETLDLASQCSPDLVLVSTALAAQAESPGAMETARRLIESWQVPVLLVATSAAEFSTSPVQIPLGMACLPGPVSEETLLLAVSAALRQAGISSARERRRRLIEQSMAALPDGVITADIAGFVTYANAQATALLGKDSACLIGHSLEEILQTAPSGAVAASLPLELDGSITGSLVVLRRPGPEGPTAIQTPDGLAEGLPDPLLALDTAQKITRLNPSAASLLGAPAAALVGTALAGHLELSEPDKFAGELRRALEENTSVTFQFRVDQPDTWWQARVFPLSGELLLLLQNITQQKRNAEDAERLSRLEGLSHLARGFTHEFNNLLTILMGNLALARAQAGPGELLRLLEESESATRRARDLVEQLTTFAKGGAPIKGLIPLRPVLNEVLVRRPASSRISYRLQFDGTEFTLDADPKQLRRLFENLVLNGEQAIAGRGEILIRCYRQDEPDPAVPSPCPCLVIEVRDTGCGMSEDTLKRAFDPFFTTRALVNATGLGLTVCESIAKAHGGVIVLKSNPGEGTLAEVRLPIQATAAPIPAKDPLQRRPLNGRKPSDPESSGSLRRILVLEDESLIRRLIHSTLTQAGYQVDETWDGTETVEAYRRARETGQPYDLLIMDLAIENGMGGVEAMSRIRNLDPAVLAIVSSGYCDDPAMSRPRDYGFTSVLPKPYQPRSLVEAVEQVLSQRQSGS